MILKFLRQRRAFWRRHARETRKHLGYLQFHGYYLIGSFNVYRFYEGEWQVAKENEDLCRGYIELWIKLYRRFGRRFGYICRFLTGE